MRRVYIGRLSHHVRERDIEKFFRSEGKISDVLMKDGFAFVEFEHSEDAEAAVRHLNGRDLVGERVHVEFAKGPPRGGRGPPGRGPNGRNGMVGGRSFRNDRGRDRDRGDHHGSGRNGGGGGDRGISYAEKYGPPRNTDYRVIVENLSSRVSWQDLKDFMRQAGEVTFADAHKRERNVGIVDFASHKDMKIAIETLNDKEFHGRRIRILEDKGHRNDSRGSGGRTGGSGSSRRGGRSRSRSRTRSRSRSRSRSRTRSRSRSQSKSRAMVSSSRSASRDRNANSRSRSVSPVNRERDGASRSRSRSRSRSPVAPCERGSKSRSRSKSPASRNASNSKSRSRSRSGSGSPVARKDAYSRSPSKSPADKDNNSGSGSKSPIAHDRDASRSRSPSNSS